MDKISEKMISKCSMFLVYSFYFLGKTLAVVVGNELCT